MSSMNSLLVVYLHGFRSSPRSSKAQMTGDAIAHRVEQGSAIEWYCPQLLASPRESMDIVQRHIDAAKADCLTVIGSSLGGFYTNYLAERYGCKGIALNPAVRAGRELAPHVGMMTAYDSEEPFDFRAEYIDELNRMQVESITLPERYLLLAATGDELLDWREMAAFYPGAKQIIIEGSDHGIANYSDYLDAVIDFACN
jgi:predicted esterase YcpF (UPF0227 family)